jgi:meso-butanediol dehydrogenase / (S,S)-butanediol dehydrogenase / diacetyl reductase
VVVTGRDRERGAAIERELAANGPIAFLEADVRLPAAADAAVRETQSRFGGIDILVASAGVGVVSPLAETTAEDWESIWTTNVSGTLFAAQAGIRAMRVGGITGSIVLIGSDAGMLGERSIGAYSVSKAAVIMMTKLLALDGAGDRIRVNCVCPGFFEPGMRHFPDRSRPEADPDQGGYTDPPAPPIGRFAKVAEIAREVLHFADARTSFCTGSVLLVDGGATAGIP